MLKLLISNYLYTSVTNKFLLKAEVPIIVIFYVININGFKYLKMDNFSERLTCEILFI